MKSKYLFQLFVLLALAVSALGTGAQAQAKSNLAEVQIVLRAVIVWDATYAGQVSATRYEMWPFELAAADNFIVTATSTSGDLTLALVDANGNELAKSTGSLTSSRPAGSYAIVVAPGTGSGSYSMTFKQIVAAASLAFDKTTVDIGGTAKATVGLNGVPAAEGFTSAEFTCVYDAAMLEVSGIADAGRFGTDAAMAVNGPQEGKFIVALAGSKGNKATTNGAAFTFDVKALKEGQATVKCDTRVSKGDNVLTAMPAVTADLTVTTPKATIAGKVVASKPVKVCVYDASNAETCKDANEDGTFSMQLIPGDYKVVAKADGFLSAENAKVTAVAGQTATLQDVNLVAGDIDGNGVVDQFDAMTIGMSYNTATPAAADLNKDGNINVLDLELLAKNYRQTGPTTWALKP